MAETEKNQQNHQKSCDSCLGSEICDLGSPDKCGFYLPFEDFRAKALEEHADNVANAKFKSIVNEILKTKERGTCMSQEKEKNVDSLADTFSVEFDDIFEAEEDATSANEKINDSVNVDDAEEVVNEQESDNSESDVTEPDKEQKTVAANNDTLQDVIEEKTNESSSCSLCDDSNSEGLFDYFHVSVRAKKEFYEYLDKFSESLPMEEKYIELMRRLEQAFWGVMNDWDRQNKL